MDPSSETVRLHLVISIKVDDEVDTGRTVEAWNAMSDTERRLVVQQLWNIAAERDHGGVLVLTDGAEQV